MASKCLMVPRLLRSNRLLKAAASPFAGCYHSFNSSATPNDYICSRCSHGKGVHRGSWSAMREHPFLTQIFTPMCSVNEYLVETIVKVEMPGVSKEGLNFEIKNNGIHVAGKTEKQQPGMIYAGFLDVPPGLYNTDQINVSMKFGVLEFVIPRLKPKEIDNPLISPFKYEPMIIRRRVS